MMNSLLKALGEPISALTKTMMIASSSRMGYLSIASHSAAAFLSLFGRSLISFLPVYIVVRRVVVFVAVAAAADDAAVFVWLDVVAGVGIPKTSFLAFSLFKSYPISFGYFQSLIKLNLKFEQVLKGYYS